MGLDVINILKDSCEMHLSSRRLFKALVMLLKIRLMPIQIYKYWDIVSLKVFLHVGSRINNEHNTGH